MCDWLAHRARSTPDRTALVAADTGSTWEYADLDVAASEAAGRLATLGVSRGDHLGVVLSARVEYVTLVHAAMRLGAVLVPLGDDLTVPELETRIERADLTAVVVGAETAETVGDAVDDVPLVSVDAVDAESDGDDEDDGDDGAEDAEADGDAPVRLGAVDRTDVDPAPWDRDDTLLMLFTSGTTGRPKLVRLTMGNVLASAVASAFRLGVVPGDRWLVTLSLHHMGGIAPIYRSAIYGTTVVLRESFDPGGAADDVATYDVTGISLVPTMLKRMLDARGTLADSLRFVLLGGAPAPRELIERCRHFSVPVFPTYGMTETASQVATARPQEAFDHEGTVGTALFWTDVTVVDEEGAELPAGESGEVVVSGPTVTPGYYDGDDGDGDGDGAYSEHGFHTGDIGYLDESNRLYVLNRLDDRILTGGETVDPGEVADAVRTHEAVEDVAVVGVPDEEWGERVAALVVADDGLTATEIREFCRDRLAGYKLPRTVRFADELPRTVSGTIDRDAVRERLGDSDPDEPRFAFESDGDGSDGDGRSDGDADGFEPAAVEPADDESDGDGGSSDSDGADEGDDVADGDEDTGDDGGDDDGGE